MTKDWLGPVAVTALLTMLGGLGAIAIDSIRDLEARMAVAEQRIEYLLYRQRGGGR